MNRPDKEQRTSFLDRALRMLGEREHPCRELKKKLIMRGCPESEADEIIKKCLGWGYIDDKRFAERFASEKLSCGWGLRRILSELINKGVNSETASEACDIASEKKGKSAQYESALKLARRKAALGRSFASICRFLSYRGFDYETVLKSSKEALSELDNESSDEIDKWEDFD